VYIEPFLGGGAIMRLKKPALASIGIDSDTAVIQGWSEDIPGLELWNTDALTWLASNNFSGDTLIYCDPPYLMETRSCKQRYYAHEFYTREEHSRLLEIIKRLSCMVIISGYYSDLYATGLVDWRTEQYPSRTRGGRTAIEWVWMNYPEPLELHDYRYLGSNFRERERIKRKQNRWRARLQRMPTQERHALLSAIDELRSAGIAVNNDVYRQVSPDIQVSSKASLFSMVLDPQSPELTIVPGDHTDINSDAAASS